MIGTTRSRVSFFMNKFRKLGLIDYNGSIEIHPSLLNVVLHEKPEIKPETSGSANRSTQTAKCFVSNSFFQCEPNLGWDDVRVLPLPRFARLDATKDTFFSKMA